MLAGAGQVAAVPKEVELGEDDDIVDGLQVVQVTLYPPTSQLENLILQESNFLRVMSQAFFKKMVGINRQ